MGMAVATTTAPGLNNLDGVRGRTVLLEATVGVNVRLVSVRGVHGALAGPSSGFNSAPLVSLLDRC
jgi:hypothetical protein